MALTPSSRSSLMLPNSTTSISRSPPYSPIILLPPLIKFSKIPRIFISIPPSKFRNRHISVLEPIKCSTIPNPSSSSSKEGESVQLSRIFIKGLSRSTTEGCLVKVFSCFGDITRVKIISSKSSRESLGLAYIWFAGEEDALLAVKEMDGKFVDGRFIAVMMARPEAPSKHVKTAPYRFR